MFTNASREVVSMDGDGRNNNSTGNVKDDETKSTSAVEQLQDGSILIWKMTMKVLAAQMQMLGNISLVILSI